MTTLLLIIALLATPSSVWAGRPNDLKQMIGREYGRGNPEGMQCLRGSALINGNAFSGFSICLGTAGERTAVWADKIRNGDSPRAVRKITDILEISPLEKNERIGTGSCYLVETGIEPKKLTGEIAIGVLGKARSPFLNSPWRTLRAWTINAETGKIKTLNPEKVECLSGGK